MSAHNKCVLNELAMTHHLWGRVQNLDNPVFTSRFLSLRWLVGLKLIQLKQQKMQPPLIILAKKYMKRYMKIFELEINYLHIQVLAAKMT